MTQAAQAESEAQCVQLCPAVRPEGVRSQVRNSSSLRISVTSVTVPADGEDDMRNGVDLGNVFKQGYVMKI